MQLTNGLAGLMAFHSLHSMLILAVLACCSLVCLSVILERTIYFRRIEVDPEKTLLKIRKSLVAGDTDEALQILGESKGNPILELIRAGVKGSQLSKEQLAEVLRACAIRQRAGLERNLGLLGTLGNVSPFIGLLGTVMGIIQAFHDLAGTQAGGGANVVASGIAEALIATAAGLLVAIPAVVFYNHFLRKVKGALLEMEAISAALGVLFSTPASSGGIRGQR